MSEEAEVLPELDEGIVAEAEKAAAGESAGSEGAQAAPDLGLIMEVPLRLSVEIGSANLPVRDVLSLSKGSVVELDRATSEPADIYVNDRLIARGEIVSEDDRVSVRITELVAAQPVVGAG